MNSATWTNGKKIVPGHWSYSWSRDIFTVILASKDRITGQQRRMQIKGETPEWGNWRLVRQVRKMNYMTVGALKTKVLDEIKAAKR